MRTNSSIPTDVLNSIQIDYKRNLKPKEIGKKYGYTAKQISDLAYRNKWGEEKKENNAKNDEKIRKKIRLSDDQEIAKIKADGRIIALNTLIEVMRDKGAKNSDRVNAASGFLKVTGDCTQTNKIEGELNNTVKNIPPDEWQKINEHIYDFIKN